MNELRKVKIISEDGTAYRTKIISEATGEELMTVTDLDIVVDPRRGDIEAKITVLLPKLDITAQALFDVYGLHLRRRADIRAGLQYILQQRSTGDVAEEALYEIMHLLDESVMFGPDE